MICPNCNNQVEPGKNFCTNCGFNLTNNVQPQNTFNQNDNSFHEEKKKNILPIIIIVIVVIGVALFVVFKLLKKDTNTTNNNEEIKNTENNTVDEEEEKEKEKLPSNIDPYSDDYDPFENSEYTENGPFLMNVTYAYTSPNTNELIILGIIERGEVKAGDEVQIIGLDKKVIQTEVVKVLENEKEIESASMGSDPGLVLKDVKNEDVQKGQSIIKPDTIKTSTKFDANIYVYTAEYEGRSTPFSSNYKVKVLFRSAEVDGNIILPSSVNQVSPGDTADVTIEINSSVAMEKGTKFKITEGGRTVGVGTVTKTY